MREFSESLIVELVSLFNVALVPVCSGQACAVYVVSMCVLRRRLATATLSLERKEGDGRLSVVNSWHATLRPFFFLFSFFVSIFIVENSKLLQQLIEHGVRILNCLFLVHPLYARINSFIKLALVFVVDGYFCSCILHAQQGLHQYNVWQLYALWLYKIASGL